MKNWIVYCLLSVQQEVGELSLMHQNTSTQSASHGQWKLIEFLHVKRHAKNRDHNLKFVGITLFFLWYCLIQRFCVRDHSMAENDKTFRHEITWNKLGTLDLLVFNVSELFEKFQIKMGYSRVDWSLYSIQVFSGIFLFISTINSQFLILDTL